MTLDGLVLLSQRKNKEEIRQINRQLSQVEASAGRLEDNQRDLRRAVRDEIPQQLNACRE